MSTAAQTARTPAGPLSSWETPSHQEPPPRVLGQEAPSAGAHVTYVISPREHDLPFGCYYLFHFTNEKN